MRSLSLRLVLIAVAWAAIWGHATAAYGGDNLPNWMLEAAHATVPQYPSSTRAAVLYEEEVLTVQPDSKAAVLHKRLVIKILRQQGRYYATVVVPIDKDRRLHSLHAWSIGPDGRQYTLKDSDFVETGNSSYGILYDDLHLKVARAPGADPGAIVGYEYDQSIRPYMTEEVWRFQSDLPVDRSVFELDLPPGWKYYAAWLKHTPVSPAEVAPNHFRWEVERVPAIDTEDVPLAPEAETLAGRMAVHYSNVELPKGDRRWAAIGDWYSNLALPRANITPEITAEAQRLTAGDKNFAGKLQAITGYMQSNIRYVGIEIGIGGLQPHAAQDIYRDQYGDCKDKVTLLKALLGAAGIESTWVLVDTHRGFVDPALPSAEGNHAISAIELPESLNDPKLQSVVTTKAGKRYLIFDPTDRYTPLGQIRPELQGSYGILALGEASELILLPKLSPEADLMERSAKFELLPDGTLKGVVTEKRFGGASLGARRTFAEQSEKDQREFVEHRLVHDLPSFALSSETAENATKLEKNFVINYSVSVPGYAKTAGNLLLIRPRILGSDALALNDRERTYPLDLGAIMTRRDHYDITLPAGYIVDELPDPVSLETSFATYHSSVKVDGNILHYAREYITKQLELEPQQYAELRKMQGRIAYDEQNTAVLKKQ